MVTQGACWRVAWKKGKQLLIMALSVTLVHEEGIYGGMLQFKMHELNKIA